MGKMILTIRFHHGTLTIRAASSISFDNCSIAFIPLREANGRYLIDPTSIRIKKVLDNPHVIPMDRKAAPKAIEGIR